MIIKQGKLSFFLIVLLSLLIASCATIRGKRESPAKATKRVGESIEVLTEMVDIAEEGIPPILLRKAYGIAIIPRVFKAAYGIGGQYGKGILLVRNDEGGWSNPSFISLTGGSLGWQIGVQSADFLLVFKSKRSIENITRGKFTLGADASITAGPVGRGAEASTDIELKAEIYSYSQSRGLFVGVSIKGASLKIDHDANLAFYGKWISPREILRNKKLIAPAIAKKLRKILSKYTQ